VVVAIAAACPSVAAAEPPSITEYPAPANPNYITTGPDGALWFTAGGGQSNGVIGRITTSGAVTTYPIPDACPSPRGSPPCGGGPVGIAVGSDGALWFTEVWYDASGSIGRITTSGAITMYAVPGQGNQGIGPLQIAAGPDGAMWFTEQTAPGPSDWVGRITMSGTITEYANSTTSDGTAGITSGPDGAMWFTDQSDIGRITTAGQITHFPVDISQRTPYNIVAGSDGALWFTTADDDQIGRITTSGTQTYYPTPTTGSGVAGIASGPDGALWFTENGGPATGSVNNIGRITTSGAITEYAIPTPQSDPVDITAGPDGAMWFTELSANKIGRITVPSSSLPPSTSPPPPAVSIPGGQLLGGVLSRGLAIALGCTRLPCTISVALESPSGQLHAAGDGRGRRLALVVVGRARFVITRRGRRIVRVRLFAGARRHFHGLRQLHLTVVVTATRSGHTSRPAVRHVVLRR